LIEKFIVTDLKEVQVEVDVDADELVEEKPKASVEESSKPSSAAALLDTMKKKQQNTKSTSKGKQGSMLDFFKKKQ
jgi:hypothetical protein